MEEYQGILQKENKFNSLDLFHQEEKESKIISLNPIQNESENQCSDRSEINIEVRKSIQQQKNAIDLFRLFVKNGEYVYARSNDIIMIESCDHLVKVYLACNEVVKKAIRHNTLKDILLLLPQDQFIRIGRFCAVNINRLSGGNCKDQTFEFDFKLSIKLKHPISPSSFSTIGK